MGQVPSEKTTNQRILLIGDGRLAKNWAAYLDQLNISYQRWFRKKNIDINTFLETDIVFLAISDVAIEGFIQDHPWLRDKTVVHFSGACYFEDLLGIHPLMTFSPSTKSLDFYQQIPLAIDFPVEDFNIYFPYLKNPVWFVPKELKPLYHALCVMSGNFAQILWEKIETEIADIGCPVEGWKRFILQSCHNFFENSHSLTGPLQRQDSNTIRKNLQALEGTKEYELYRAFLNYYKVEV